MVHSDPPFGGIAPSGLTAQKNRFLLTNGMNCPLRGNISHRGAILTDAWKTLFVA